MEEQYSKANQRKKLVLEKQDSLAEVEELPNQTLPTLDVNEPSTSTGITVSNSGLKLSHVAVYVSPDSSDSTKISKNDNLPLVVENLQDIEKEQEIIMEKLAIEDDLSSSESYVDFDFTCCCFKKCKKPDNKEKEDDKTEDDKTVK